MQLSVVIPTLNEALSLPTLLNQLNAQSIRAEMQILVSDGGSTDATIDLAQPAADRVISTSPGRSNQLNAAVQATTSNYLLFLHADSRIQDAYLLERALEHLTRYNKGDHRHAGHFRLQFTDAKPSLLYRYMQAKTALNRPYCFNGDQGLLIHRQYLQALGGFDSPLPFFEDQLIATRIRKSGSLITLPGLLETSARRFESAGRKRQYLLMSMIMGLHGARLTHRLSEIPNLYRLQSEMDNATAGQNRGLDMRPFFRWIWGIMRQLGIRKSIWHWSQNGKMAAENAWQPFFFVDIATGMAKKTGRYPCLQLYDRTVTYLVNNRIGYFLCGGLMAFVYLCLFWPAVSLWHSRRVGHR